MYPSSARGHSDRRGVVASRRRGSSCHGLRHRGSLLRPSARRSHPGRPPTLLWDRGAEDSHTASSAVWLLAPPSGSHVVRDVSTRRSRAVPGERSIVFGSALRSPSSAHGLVFLFFITGMSWPCSLNLRSLRCPSPPRYIPAPPLSVCSSSRSVRTEVLISRTSTSVLRTRVSGRWCVALLRSWLRVAPQPTGLLFADGVDSARSAANPDRHGSRRIPAGRRRTGNLACPLAAPCRSARILRSRTRA